VFQSLELCGLIPGLRRQFGAKKMAALPGRAGYITEVTEPLLAALAVNSPSSATFAIFAFLRHDS